MNKPAVNSIDIGTVKYGLALALLTVLVNIGFGALFGLDEDLFQNYIHNGIAANPALFTNPVASQAIIWRWVERAHFHAGGIGAFTLGLVILTAISNMSPTRKQITALLLGLSIFYPFAWFAMFLYAPYVGTAVAHHVMLVEIFTDIGVGTLCLGLLSLILGIFFVSGGAETSRGAAQKSTI